VPNFGRSSQSGNACLTDAGGAPLTEDITLGQRLIPSRLVGRELELSSVSTFQTIHCRAQIGALGSCCGGEARSPLRYRNPPAPRDETRRRRPCGYRIVLGKAKHGMRRDPDMQVDRIFPNRGRTPRRVPRPPSYCASLKSMSSWSVRSGKQQRERWRISQGQKIRPLFGQHLGYVGWAVGGAGVDQIRRGIA
jgi:hypothetical protein